MAASSSSARVTRMTPMVALRDAVGIAKRNLLRTIRLPGEASVLIIQPVVILLLCRYVLGGAIKVPGGNYADYLVPAVFVEAMLLAGMSTATGLAQDLTSGIIDRFRSLPMARSAVLAGRTLSDLVRLHPGGLLHHRGPPLPQYHRVTSAVSGYVRPLDDAARAGAGGVAAAPTGVAADHAALFAVGGVAGRVEGELAQLRDGHP
jgi:hypothetical protein